MIWIVIAALAGCSIISLTSLGVEGNKLTSEPSCFPQMLFISGFSLIGLATAIAVAWPAHG